MNLRWKRKIFRVSQMIFKRDAAETLDSDSGSVRPTGCSRNFSMDAEVRTYLRFSRDIRIILTTVGVWPGICPTFERIIAYLGQVSTVILVIGLVHFLTLHGGNVLLISKCTGLSISVLSAIIKIYVFLRHRNDLVNLNDYLSTRYRRDLSNPQDRPYLLRHVLTFVRFFYILTIAVALTVISAEVEAIKGYISGVYRHVYPIAFPINNQPGDSIFWTFVGIEFIAGYYMWAVTSGVDSVFGMYTLELCGELRVLASRFQNLRTSKDYKVKLRECVKRHHAIIKSKDVLQNVFGFLSIWLAVTSAIVQCSLVFQAKAEAKAMSAVYIGFLFFYMLMKLLQAFTYTWYGNLITRESLLCMNAMYNAHWPGSGNLHFMNDVLIVLSQKPVIFKASGFMRLNFEIFIKILNAAVSYFFLLQTLDNKSDRK